VSDVLFRVRPEEFSDATMIGNRLMDWVRFEFNDDETWKMTRHEPDWSEDGNRKTRWWRNLKKRIPRVFSACGKWLKRQDVVSKARRLKRYICGSCVGGSKGERRDEELEADRTSGPEPASRAGGDLMQEETFKMFKLKEQRDCLPRVVLECFGVLTTFRVDIACNVTYVARSQMAEWG